MKVDIISRAVALKLVSGDFPPNTAVISFYTPNNARRVKDLRIDYSSVCDMVFYIAVPDIDLKCLSDFGYTYDSYIEDTAELARFIYEARLSGRDIICQCDFGQSRSAACAAAILQHFEGRGIDIFTDYRYYPNQLVYHKIFDALEMYGDAARTGGDEKNEKIDLRKTREFLEYGFKIVTCPICAEQTLDSSYICQRCGWEYDGVVEKNDYSSANSATVAEYRAKYKKTT